MLFIKHIISGSITGMFIAASGSIMAQFAVWRFDPAFLLVAIRLGAVIGLIMGILAYRDHLKERQQK